MTPHTSFRPASLDAGRERREDRSRDSPQVTRSDQELGNIVGSAPLPSGKSCHTPGRKRPGDTHRGASDGPPHSQEKMPYHYFQLSRAGGKGQCDSHRPHNTAWSPAPVHPWCVLCTILPSSAPSSMMTQSPWSTSASGMESCPTSSFACMRWWWKNTYVRTASTWTFAAQTSWPWPSCQWLAKIASHPLNKVLFRAATFTRDNDWLTIAHYVPTARQPPSHIHTVGIYMYMLWIYRWIVWWNH